MMQSFENKHKNFKLQLTELHSYKLKVIKAEKLYKLLGGMGLSLELFLL